MFIVDGPVLDPFLVAVVKCIPKVNPLLTPAPEDLASRNYLTWNMLFPSNYVHRSNEPGHLSWSEGRDTPATFPRLTALRLISHQFPWFVDIVARNRNVGVTCGEVIDQLSDFLNTPCSKSEYHAVPAEKRRQIDAAYYNNRGMSHDVPGGRLGQGLKYLDFLREDSEFGGIEVDTSYVRERMSLRNNSRDLSCVFVVHCSKRLGQTQDEVTAHGLRGSRPPSRAE